MSFEDFGPYRLETLLGRGGMGEVFRAFDHEHGRLVALKRLAAHLADDPEFQGRFRREAQLAAKLRNPHIVPIHRFGELDGHLFIDMRYIEGFDVGELIDTVGALAPHRAVSILEQVGSALGTAHAAGLVHRDVKPSNVLIDQENSDNDRDFAYLVDFGISRPTSTTPTHSLTRTGAILGSIAYMAPEQFDGMADSRSDVYALTCVFFELLTGSKPYQGSGLPALMHAHLNVPPPSASSLRPALPAGIDDVIRHGMAKRPDERFGSTAELVRAARSALSGSDTVPVDPAQVPDRPVAKSVAPHDDTRTDPADPVPPIQSENATTTSDSPSAATTPNSLTDHHRDLADIATRRRTRRIAIGDGIQRRARPPAAVAATVLAVVLIGALVLLLARPSTTAGVAGSAPSALPPTSPTAPPTSTAPESTGTLVAEAVIPVGKAPQGVAQSPDGGTLYVADTTARTLVVVDLPRRTVRTTVPLPGVPHYVATSRDGQRVFVSMYAEDGSGSGVAVLDMPNGVLARVVMTGPKPYALATAPDGRIYVPNHDASNITVIDPGSLQTVATVTVSQNPHAVAFSPQGGLAYSADHESNTVAVIDTATHTVRRTVDVGNSPHSLVVAPDGGEIAVANYGAGTVSVIASTSDSVVRSFPVGRTPQSLAYSADGKYLYVGNEEDDKISIIDAHSGQVTSSVPVGTSPRFVLLAPDGVHLVVSSSVAGQLAVLRTTR